MLTPAKLTANQANARKSTGPTTEAGKAMVALNPVRHGLTAVAPVITGEHPAEWEYHRAATVAALAPVGHLEHCLADRAAALLWRLGRVVRYEAAVTSAGIAEKAEKGDSRDWIADLVGPKTEPDEAVLEKVRELAAAARAESQTAATAADWLSADACPDDEPVPAAIARTIAAEAHEYVAGELGVDCPDPAAKGFLAAVGSSAKSVKAVAWTAGMVRQGLAFYAAASGQPTNAFTPAHRDRLRQRAADRAADAERGDARVVELTARVAAAADRKRAKLLLPDPLTVQKIAWYEAHLGRQLEQTLNRLERVQALRAGKDVPPPAAGTLVVEVAEPGAGGADAAH